jgi:alkanesulfonate monooxygenase SsuD/methylene tetrahydromethanopterin reductase-like flavin-dependent oxidoreductase (luciferase family)
MRSFEIGVVLSSWRSTTDASTVPWSEIRDLALRAEAIGLDTVWSPDELIGRLVKDGPRYGFWDGIAIPAALAAATSRIKVGTWVLSSLHRNPGITAKAAETIDEISGGRLVLGLGAGHAGSGAHAFGLPEDHIYERFEEALEIVVPLLRRGQADFGGAYYVARDLEQLPRGPRPNGIPILLAAHGPKGYRHAARLADVWSCYAEGRSDVAELGPRVAAFEAACAEVGRDPSTIGRSAGVVVAPLEKSGTSGMFGTMIGGSAQEIADSFRSFRAAGFTQLEFMLHPQTAAALEAMAPVLGLLDVGEQPNATPSRPRSG